MESLTQVADAFPVILGLLVRGALLLAVATVVTVGLRRVSSATRHLVWAAAMTGLLVLPLAGVLAPELRVVPAGLFPASVAAPGAVARIEGPADRAARDGGANDATPLAVDGRSVDSPSAEGAGSPGASTAAIGAEPTGRPDARAEIGATDTGGGAPAGIPLAGWLTAIWLVGVVVLLVPLVASVAAIRRLRRRLPDLDAPRIRHRATRLALRVGVRREFRLLEGDEGAMPMTFGGRRPAILLPSTARTWSADRLDAVLLHELAHIRRRDTLTQMVAEVARAIHWVNPLAWLAIRRLEVEREHACDDIALARGARASDYADELLGLARRYRSGRVAGRAALALARPGRLGQRLRAVLDDERRRSELPRGAAWKATVLAATVVVPLAALAPAATADLADPPAAVSSGPAADQVASAAGLSAPTWPPAPRVSALKTAGGTTPDRASGSENAAVAAALQNPTCISEPGEWDGIQSRSNNGRRTVMLEREDCELEVRLEGEIQLDAAGIEVAGMARDARLTMEEDDGQTIRSLEVLPGDDGGLVFEYRENRRGHAFDSAARAWYRAVLLELFRTTGLMADARVRTLLDRGGVEAVLRELGHLRGDLAYAKHVETLVERARLDEAETRALIRGSADRVESDHWLAGILQGVAEHQEMTAGTLDDFVQATRRLDSDHYRTEALTTALTSGRLSDDQVGLVLRAAGEMDSDHYRTQILGGVADRYALQPAFRQHYLQATASMDSDHYRTEVLNRLLDRNDLSADEKAAVLEAAAMLDSDHYRTELLRNVATRGLGEAALHEAYFRVAAGLDSDHYYREAMGLLLNEPVSDGMLVTVLEHAARELESDHYKADLLLAVLERRAPEGRVREAFLGAMDSMDSEHYRGRVADALLQAER